MATWRERYGTGGAATSGGRLRPRGRAEYLTGLVALCLIGGGAFMSQLPVAAAPTVSGIILDEDGSGQASGGPLSSAQARALLAGWEQLTAHDPQPPREVGVLPRPAHGPDPAADPASVPAVPSLPPPGTQPPTNSAPRPTGAVPGAGQQSMQRPVTPGAQGLLTPVRPDTGGQPPVVPAQPAPSTPVTSPTTPVPSPLVPAVPTPEEPGPGEHPDSATDPATTHLDGSPTSPAAPRDPADPAGDPAHPAPTD